MAHIWCTWDHSILLRTSSTIVDIRESEDNWIKNDIWLKNDSIWRNTMFNTLNFLVKLDSNTYLNTNMIKRSLLIPLHVVPLQNVFWYMEAVYYVIYERFRDYGGKITKICSVRYMIIVVFILYFSPRWFCWCFWLTACFCIASCKASQ